MSKNTKKNGNKALDIISTIIVILLFLFGATCLIFSFTGNSLYLFGTRFDVCLTDSMSVKNEQNIEFLNDYDDQIQPFDLVVSKKVEKDEDLNIGDIVVYNNPNIGTDCHRVVDIVTYIKDEVTISYAELIHDDNYYLKLFDTGSTIQTNSMHFTTACLKLRSKTSYHNNFDFYISFNSFTPTVSETYIDGYYYIELTIKNNIKSSERLTISHSSYYDYSNDEISELNIDSQYGDIHVLPNELIQTDESTFSRTYNESKKFEIRGDKAPNSDGYFDIKQIHSKVTNIVPKLGYVIRFFSSLRGTILLVGLIGIIVLADFLLSKNKLLKGETAEETTTKNQVLNNESEETNKTSKES